jgi:RND family efflux transporter MFP subunit
MPPEGSNPHRSEVDRYVRSLIVVAIAACAGEKPPQTPPPTGVDAVTLAATPVVDSTEYLGMLRSRTAANIQPQVDGQVVQIFVKPGDSVEPGQALLQIDPKRQSSTVNQVKATQAAREATLRLAEINRDRVKKLVDDGALARQELDNAETALHTARAEVEAAGAELGTQTTQLAYFRVAAPSAGVVGDIPVRVGDRVAPQTVLTTVTDNRVLEANISIPVTRSKDIHAGGDIQIVDDSGKAIATGKLAFVSMQVNPDTQSVLVKSYIDNTAGLLRSDQLVRARVVWSQHPGIVVPALAVNRLGGQAFVYVVEQAPQGTLAKQRSVVLGDLVGNSYVVVSGLKAGEQIVTGGLQKVHDSAPIAVKR